MSIDVRKYLNQKFELGTTDCYSLIREFYLEQYEINLPDYARPEGFWRSEYNLYMEYFEEEGFYTLGENPREWQEGDVFLMAIGSPHATHAAIFLGNNKILHLFTGRVSTIDSYKGQWRNKTIVRLRHKTQKNRIQKIEEYNLINHPHVKSFLNK